MRIRIMGENTMIARARSQRHLDLRMATIMQLSLWVGLAMAMAVGEIVLRRESKFTRTCGRLSRSCQRSTPVDQYSGRCLVYLKSQRQER